MTIRVEIDPNVRVRGNKTYAGLEDADGPLAVGDKVLAYESEAGIVFDAEVADIDRERGFVFLTVDWRSCRDEIPAGWACPHMSITSAPGVLAQVDLRCGCALTAVYGTH